MRRSIGQKRPRPDFTILKAQNVIGGGLLVLLAAASYLEAQRYTIGTAFRMGPGYLPVALSLVLGGLGVLLLISGVRFPVAPAARPAWRSLLAICMSIAVFALLIRSAGLLPAIVATTFTASLAEPLRHFGRICLLAIFLAGLSWLIFVEILGLPISIARWPL